MRETMSTNSEPRSEHHQVGRNETHDDITARQVGHHEAHDDITERRVGYDGVHDDILKRRVGYDGPHNDMMKCQKRDTSVKGNELFRLNTVTQIEV